MNEFDAINSEYKKVLGFNKTDIFIHSIDREKYKADCEDFFVDINNKKMFLDISKEADFANFESEKLLLNWLLKG